MWAKTTWYWVRTLLKTLAEAERVWCEYQARVALCAWKHRFLSFIYSGTAISDGSSGLVKHQQHVKFCVRTRGSTQPFKRRFCFLWRCRLLLSGILVLTIYFSAILWEKLQGKRDCDPFCGSQESKAACNGGTLLHCCNFPFLEFSVETGLKRFFHYTKK